MSYNYVTNYTRNLNIDFESSENNKIDLKEGEVVEAEVMEDSANPEKIKLKFENNDVISVNKGSVSAKTGEKISVEIKENIKGKIVIKQVKPENLKNSDSQNISEKNLSVSNVKTDYNELLSKINVAYTKENAAYAKFLNENNVAVKAENIKLLNEIKKNVDYIIKNADEAVIGKIEASGIDTGKLSPEVLSKFIYEIKNNNFTIGQESTSGYDIDNGFKQISDEEAKNAAKEYVKENLSFSKENDKKYETLKSDLKNAEKDASGNDNKTSLGKETIWRRNIAQNIYGKGYGGSDDLISDRKRFDKGGNFKNTLNEKNYGAELSGKTLYNNEKISDTESYADSEILRKEIFDDSANKEMVSEVKTENKVSDKTYDSGKGSSKEVSQNDDSKETTHEVKIKNEASDKASDSGKDYSKETSQNGDSGETDDEGNIKTDSGNEESENEKKVFKDGNNKVTSDKVNIKTDKVTKIYESDKTHKKEVGENNKEFIEEVSMSGYNKKIIDMTNKNTQETTKTYDNKVASKEEISKGEGIKKIIDEGYKKAQDNSKPHDGTVGKEVSKEENNKNITEGISEKTEEVNSYENKDIPRKEVSKEENNKKVIEETDKKVEEIKVYDNKETLRQEVSSNKDEKEAIDKADIITKEITKPYEKEEGTEKEITKNIIEKTDEKSDETIKSDNIDKSEDVKQDKIIDNYKFKNSKNHKFSEFEDFTYNNKEISKKTESGFYPQKVNDFEKNLEKNNNEEKNTSGSLKSSYEDKEGYYNDLKEKIESNNNDFETSKTAENIQSESADIKKIQDKYSLSNDEIENIIKNIIKADIPINEKNIEAVASAYVKAKNIKVPDDKTILNIVKSDKELTLQNIYIAEYTSKNMSISEDFSNTQWNQLKNEVLKLFKREDIEITKENVKIAKIFIENDIPVTKENIEKAEFLKDLKDGMNLDKITFDAAENIKLDKKADAIDLFTKEGNILEKQPQQIFEDYKEIIKIIPKINTSVIKEVLKKDEVLSLENLKNEFLENVDKYEESPEVSQKDANDKSYAEIDYKNNFDIKTEPENKNSQNFIKPENDNFKQVKEELSPEVITAKRQLAEIQLKLTYESALRLAGKSIDINVEPIKEAVSELKKLEKEVYASSLKIAGAEVSDKNVEKMSGLFEKVSSLAPEYSNNVYREIITHETDFTIEGIDSAVTAKFDKIIDTLDTFATVPSQRFGDVFSAVSDQLAHVLEINGISVNEENVDAAKILSLNNMDVTKENILQTKSINFKVSKTYNKLHPLVAAEMIKDGLNPVDMNIDDVISYIDKFDEKYTQESKEQIAENIMRVAENNEMSKTEKDAVISVYRMLDMVSKHSGAAIGTAIKNNVELTLGNLMEASKVFEKTKSKKDFDVEVNDKFGLTEDVIVPEKNIRATIEKAVSSANHSGRQNFNQTSVFDNQNDNTLSLQNASGEERKIFITHKNEAEYMNAVFDELVKSADPQKITDIIKSGNNPISDSIEKFLKNIKKNNRVHNNNINFEKETIKNVMEQIKQMSNSPSNVISWLNKNNIPVTMTNFGVASGIIKNPFKQGKDLEKFERDSKESKITFGNKISSTELEALKNGKKPDEVVNELIEEVDGALEAIIGAGDSDEIDLLLKQASNIKKSLSVQNQVNKSDSGYFQLPVRMSEGNIINLNMYVAENASNELNKTFISFETENLGVVQVYMTISEKNISLEINSEYGDGAKALSEYGDEFKRMLSGVDFEIKSIKFGEEKPQNIADEKVFEKNSQKNVKIFNNSYEIIV